MTYGRPETEEWCLALIDTLTNKLQKHPSMRFRLFDLCTGSGCIALAMAHKLTASRAMVIGCDINPNAIALAKENQRKLGISNVHFQLADIRGSSMVV